MKTDQSQDGQANRRRVLIVDDHPMTRYGLSQLINEQRDLLVCGEAGSAQEALGLAAAASPDLVVADLTLPGRSGLDLIKDLRARCPRVPVLVMSMHDESVYAERVLRAGGRGYVMKREGGARLLEAMRQVLQGQVVVSPTVSSAILAALAGARPPAGSARPGLLTDREFEVFQLLGQGLASREIAARLRVSVKTVGTHRMHIMRKLELANPAELVREAVRWSAAEQMT